MFRDSFEKYIKETNVSGSGKATSYISALNWLAKMISVEPMGFGDCKDIWKIDSIVRLGDLYHTILEQQKLANDSSWNVPNIPKSYLQKGYCSAAIKHYQKFIVENTYENHLLDIFKSYEGDGSDLTNKLEKNLICPNSAVSNFVGLQGKDVVRTVKTRANQNVFRKIILNIYNQSCCITGLNIPEVNRASHIIPWAEDESKRLDPRNGLCLSATYDSAFDRNLISLDDDYRMILSKNISDYYMNKSVKCYFRDKEGDKITLPSSFFPHKRYLETHRNKGQY